MNVTLGDSGPAVNAAIWIFFVFAVVAVALRINTRARRNHRFGWDDYVMFLSLVLNLVSCICASIAISHGLGKHINALTPEQTPAAILWGIVAIDMGILADTMPKLAVALLINSILAPGPFMRCFTITISTVLNCFAISLVVLSFVQCQPISHQWERENVPGSCWSPLIFAYYGIAVGVYSSVTDLFFSLYPPIIVSRLQMPLRKKVIVMVIFGLGLFALFTTLFKTAAELPKLRYEQVDFSRVAAQVLLWTIIESSVVIIAGSIPTWGSVLRTDKLEAFITWIVLHSQGTSHMSARLPSHGGEADKESDRVELRTDEEAPQEGQNGSVALQSIDRIERVAYS